MPWNDGFRLFFAIIKERSVSQLTGTMEKYQQEQEEWIKVL